MKYFGWWFTGVLLIVPQLFLLGEENFPLIIEFDESIQIDIEALVGGTFSNQFQFCPDVFEIEHQNSPEPRLHRNLRCKVPAGRG